MTCLSLHSSVQASACAMTDVGNRKEFITSKQPAAQMLLYATNTANYAPAWLAAGDALRGLGHAVLGWTITLAFIIAGLTVILKPVFTLLQKRYGTLLLIAFLGFPLLIGSAAVLQNEQPHKRDSTHTLNLRWKTIATSKLQVWDRRG